MNNNKKGGLPSIVRYGILIVITIAIWLVFESYREFAVKPAPPVPQEILEPLTPTLDSRALDELQRRINLGEQEIGDTVISPSAREAALAEEVLSVPVSTIGGTIDE